MAARAGIREGDVITVAAGVAAADAARVLGALRQASLERPVILAVTRGTSHLVVAVPAR
jgi:S1-C subfamily serine protease